jgi:ribonuclease HII
LTYHHQVRSPMLKPRKSMATYDIEHVAGQAGYAPVAGVDEAGRGPWAGPVVAAAVILQADAIPDGIADSKVLTATQRDRVFDEICQTAQVGIGLASAAEIDAINILNATMAAMRMALTNLPVRPALALIDGNRVPASDMPCRAIVRGDATCLSIAAASIIAKVTRDRMMIELGRLHPGYGFERHKGYGTAEHQRGIAQLGVIGQHRKSFKPIRLAIVRHTE